MQITKDKPCFDLEEFRFDFPPDTSDAVRFEPMDFRVANVAMRVLDLRYTFHLSPSLATKLPRQCGSDNNASSAGDLFNFRESTQQLEI